MVSFLAFTLTTIIGLIINDLRFQDFYLHLIVEHVLIDQHSCLILRKIILHGHFWSGHHPGQSKGVFLKYLLVRSESGGAF